MALPITKGMMRLILMARRSFHTETAWTIDEVLNLLEKGLGCTLA